MIVMALMVYRALGALRAASGWAQLNALEGREGKMVGEDERRSPRRAGIEMTRCARHWEAKGSPTRVAVTMNGRNRHCHE